MSTEDQIKKDYHFFYTTGIVRNLLFLQFDQTGRWKGRTQTTPHQVVSMLERTVLSKDQMEERVNEKVILKTGFTDTSTKDSCTIAYHEIQGPINIDNAKDVIAPHLEKCTHFYADRSRSLHLPTLQKIGGNLLARDATEFNAPMLTHIAGTLHLDGIKNLELDSLEEVEKDMIISTAQNLKIPKCQKIGKCLYSPCLQTIISPKLKEVDSLALTETPHKTIAKLVSTLNIKNLMMLKDNESQLGRIQSTALIKKISEELVKRDVRNLEPTSLEI